MTEASQRHVYVLRLMPAEWWAEESDAFRDRVTTDCAEHVARRAAADGVTLTDPGHVEIETDGNPPFAVFCAEGVRR